MELEYVMKAIKYFENYFKIIVSQEDVEELNNKVVEYLLLDLNEVNGFVLGYLTAKGYITASEAQSVMAEKDKADEN